MQKKNVVKGKNQKIKKYRKPLNINLGIVIFGVIFIYIIIVTVMYFNSKHIVGYEVSEGSLSVSKVYQGIAIREEEVIPSNSSGYINFYAKEGKKIAANELIYTIDETGELLADATNSSSTSDFSEDDLETLKNEIVSFANLFDPMDFSDTYNFKSEYSSSLNKIENYQNLENLSTLSQNENSQISYGYTTQPGYVIYQTDGYEDLTDEDIKDSLFEEDQYTLEDIMNQDLVGEGDPAYKMILSEDWSIIIQTDEARAQELLDEDYVKVKFLKNQLESWGEVSVIENGESTFVKLTFTNSMITFCTERFIDIELITDDEEGLKIPNTSIVEKEFFLIPNDYLIVDEDTDETQVIRSSYDENNEETVERIDITVYNKTDDEFYTDDSILRAGDVLRMPDSQTSYTVSKKGTLIGVYNMNKGYADFKQIIILYQNDEYSIVKSNTTYGLNVYDYIVLDADSISENDFIYE